jgi:glycosyltransferase involved in cell wall biosynthesis
LRSATGLNIRSISSKRREALTENVSVSVVICAYTEKRWEQTCAAIKSVLSQDPEPAEVLLVVDHNPAMAERARNEISGITVLESGDVPGLSGARNTGLRAASHPITAFLDDDAEARPGWMAALIQPYRSPDVVATGGAVHPAWPGLRPGWLPPEFDWVVGCSYRGLPESLSPIRNPIGANMSMRTRLALEVGGFDTGVGRVGTRPVGCEETELSIRLTARTPGASIFYVPASAVDHHVSPDRIRISYFLRRCWHEGISKATVVRLAGASSGLERERRHVAVTLPLGVLRDFRAFIMGDRDACKRAFATVAGLGFAATGYVRGRMHPPSAQ